MKKYQLWLQRKSYSQHLFNLMKIRHAPLGKLDHTLPLSRSNSPTNPRPQRSKENTRSQFSKLGDVSYAITYRELKNRKIRLMKTFEIVNENINMARRIKDVKSAFNPHSHTTVLPCDRRKIFENKCELSNEELREQNFKKFVRWQRNRVGPAHRFKLSVSIESISKFMSVRDEYAALRCELVAEGECTKSEMVQLGSYTRHEFCFPLEKELGGSFRLRLFVCKGLQSEMVGEYELARPELGQVSLGEYCSGDRRSSIEARLLYERIWKEKLRLTVK